MANVIGRLAVVISANATQAVNAFNALGKKVRGFGSSLAGFATGAFLGGPLTAIASIVSSAIPSVGSLSDQFKTLSENVREVTFDSQRLGLPVEDVMALRYAAKITDVEVTALNKALFTMSRQQGGNALENLMNAADEFGDSANRSAFAFERFGKNGFAMMSLLSKGSSGIKALMDKGKALGLVLSDVDAGKIQAARVALKQMAPAVEGMMNKALIAIAPAIETTAGLLNDLLVPAIIRFGEIAARGFEFYGGLVDWASGILGRFVKRLTSSGLGDLFSNWMQAFDVGLGVLFGVLDKLGPLLGMLADMAADAFVSLAKSAGWFGLEIKDASQIAPVVLGQLMDIGLAGAWAFDTVRAGIGLASIGLGTLASGFTDFVQGATKGVASLGDAFVGLGGNVFRGVMDAMVSLGEKIQAVFDGAAQQAIKAGKMIGGPLGRQMQEWGGEALSASQEMMDKLRAGQHANPFDKLGDDWQAARDKMLLGALDLDNELGELGRTMVKWGTEQADAFGEGALAVERFFDGIEARQRQMRPPLKPDDLASPDYHATAAAIQGGKEDVSIRAKFGVEGVVDDQKQLMRKQVQQGEQGNGLLAQILQAVRQSGIKLEEV